MFLIVEFSKFSQDKVQEIWLLTCHQQDYFLKTSGQFHKTTKWSDTCRDYCDALNLTRVFYIHLGMWFLTLYFYLKLMVVFVVQVKN